MGLAHKLYDQIDAAPDDRARFRLMADAIGQLEQRWPRAGEMARRSDVREAEPRLEVQPAEVRKEIEVVRKEIVQGKTDLLNWPVPLMFGRVAPIAALVRPL